MHPVGFGSEMLFGYQTSAGQKLPISADRDFVLCVGSHETLVRAALEAIHSHEPLIVLDLDGRSVDEILAHISRQRRPDVLLFELDWDYPPAFNPVTYCSPEHRARVANSIIETFNAVWNEGNAPISVKRWLRLPLLTLLEREGATLLDLPALFVTKEQHVIGQDPYVRDRWEAYAARPPKDQDFITDMILNRIDDLIMDTRIRHVIGQRKSFTEQKVNAILVRLPAPEIGFETAAVLAGLILSRAQGRRVFVPKPFPMPVPSNLVLGCDHLGEIPEKLRSFMLAQATIFAARTSPADEKVLAPMIGPERDYPLSQLTAGMAYLRLDQTYRLDVIPNYYPARPKSPEVIRRRSRNQIATAREIVEGRLRA